MRLISCKGIELSLDSVVRATTTEGIEVSPTVSVEVSTSDSAVKDNPYVSE